MNISEFVVLYFFPSVEMTEDIKWSEIFMYRYGQVCLGMFTTKNIYFNDSNISSSNNLIEKAYFYFSALCKVR